MSYHLVGIRAHKFTLQTVEVWWLILHGPCRVKQTYLIPDMNCARFTTGKQKLQRHITSSILQLPCLCSGTVGWGNMLQAGRSWVCFLMALLGVFIDVIPLAALWLWGKLSLQQKRVPGVSPGGKDGRHVGLTTLLYRLSSILGASTSCSPKGLSKLAMG
jgi:hypothetical protein